MNLRSRVALLGITLSLMLSSAMPQLARGADPQMARNLTAEELLAAMTPEEKVGQLFLVAFQGDDVSPGSAVARLIQERRVGGVFISAANDNFESDDLAPQRVASLANALQALALSDPAGTSRTLTTTTYTPIPLFIALHQEGDGYPFSGVWQGVTSLPDQMAIGATWNPSYAQQIGQIVGQELAALGVNVLLGPSLDVLDKPRPTLPGGLGVRTFGGDPYWVGCLGQAYIRGVHEGSRGRVMTVAKHFPGLGGADRDPNEELPTIQKSLDTLRSVELAPFFAVTSLATDDGMAVTDALMTSHVRYRGFQGNIRQLTRPISCDAQNLPAILNLPELAPWRTQGGLLVSDVLGVPSIRKFYDPSLQAFPAKRIAQEAFLAGNDVLFLAQFDLTDNWDAQLANVEATMMFFRDKYLSDPTFQVRVDESVTRILQRKLALMPEFTLEAIQVPVDALKDRVGQSSAVVARVAQEAATLLYPNLSELSERLPSPPLSDEQILLITDDRQGRACSTCQASYYIDPRALRELILQLYGPQATGQISPDQVHSLTFSQLKQMLSQSAIGPPAASVSPSAPARPTSVTPPAASATPRSGVEPLLSPLATLEMSNVTSSTTPGSQPPEETVATMTLPMPGAAQTSGLSPTDSSLFPLAPTPSALQAAELLRNADWIIFAMLDVNTVDFPNADALKQFLRVRSDSLQGKKLVVLAFNAPYFLDTTEVSKLTAYYALYSKTPPFLEAAVRLLFQEYPPRGAAPVDVEAIGYHIIEVTRPDPGQVINIEVVTDTRTISDLSTPTTTPQVLPSGTSVPIRLNLKVGDMLVLRTGRILDRNGRPVPDGTPVEFRMLDTTQEMEARLPLVTTINGVAQIQVPLQRSGTWQILAASDTAQRSVRLLLTIPEQGPVEVGIDRPTPTPTFTPAPSRTPSPALAFTPTRLMATPAPSSLRAAHTSSAGGAVSFLGLLLSLACLTMVGWLSFRLSADQGLSPVDRVRRVLVTVTVGLIGYILFALGLIPLEQVPLVAQAASSWLPYQVLPALVSLIFGSAALILVRIGER